MRCFLKTASDLMNRLEVISFFQHHFLKLSRYIFVHLCFLKFEKIA